MTEALEHVQAPVHTPLGRVDRLKAKIAEGGDEAQRLRHLPESTRDLLVEVGLSRCTLPLELGSENGGEIETVELRQAISALDASAGWNVMHASCGTSTAEMANLLARVGPCWAV